MTHGRRHKLYVQAKREVESLTLRMNALLKFPGGPAFNRRMTELEHQRQQWRDKMNQLRTNTQP